MALFDFLFKNNKKEEKDASEIVYDIFTELMDKAYSTAIRDDDINLLNDKEKVFYVLYLYNMEIQNGGLCQFFVNSTKIYAPLVSHFLKEVNAVEHKKLYDDFIKANNINLYDLSYFDIDNVEEFSEKNNSYPFDDFDDKFYTLPNLEDYLYKYFNE